MSWIEKISEVALSHIPAYAGELAVVVQEHGHEAALAVTGLLALLALSASRVSSRRTRVLEEQITRLEVTLMTLERSQIRAERQMTTIEDRLQTIAERQHKSSVRESKMDYPLALAMARAGAREKQIVDCGLSHSEAHLIEALQRRHLAPAPEDAHAPAADEQAA